MRAALFVLLLLAETAQSEPGLTFERHLESGPSFSAYLVSYQSSGLNVFAMVAVPQAPKPENGYPVIVANHGYVPDPRKYGFTTAGVNSRPGDYYRSVPELYASRGFLVVLPDYRGHNSSEGYAQIRDQSREKLSNNLRLYADDVVALLQSLDDIKDADMDRVFMWSHSMGGGVSLRALLATDVVKAASFWSTMDVSDYFDELANMDAPVIIHHAKGDTSTPHANSEQLAARLGELDQAVSLHSLDGAQHFFGLELREQAADRDAEFFLGR